MVLDNADWMRQVGVPLGQTQSFARSDPVSGLTGLLQTYIAAPPAGQFIRLFTFDVQHVIGPNVSGDSPISWLVLAHGGTGRAVGSIAAQKLRDGRAWPQGIDFPLATAIDGQFFASLGMNCQINVAVTWSVVA